MWNVAGFAIGRIVLLATTIATARILTPEDFGLLGVALTVTMFLDLLNDFGLTTAYVYFARDRDPEEVASTGFVLSILTGVALTVLTIAAAPLAAIFYDEPRVTPVLMALSANYLLVSFGSVQDGRMRARLDFRRRFFAELGRSVVKGAVTVALAVAGAGVWSLVLGQVVGTAASTILYMVLERWRPRWRLHRQLAVGMLRYGTQLLALGLVGLAAANVDAIFIGRRLGVEALGLYTLAFRLPSLAVRGASAVVSQVAFSAYAKVSDDEAALTRALLRSLRVMATYTVPVALGMAVVAPELINVLFGDKWQETGTLMQILALHTLLTVLVYNAGDVYKALGRPGLLTLHATIKLVVAVPLLWVAAGHSLEAVAWGQVGVGAVSVIVQLTLLRTALRIGPVLVVRTLLPTLGAGALMALAAAGATRLFADSTDLTRLLVATLVGAVAFSVAAWLSDPAGTRQTIALFRPGGRPPEAAQ